MYCSLDKIRFVYPDFLAAPAFAGPWTADSRAVTAGAVFLAFPGEFADGRDFIAAAVERGAAAVIYQEEPHFKPDSYAVPLAAIADLEALAGILTAVHLDNIRPGLKTAGVTGTNGKTSITQWLAQALGILGHKTAVIGTMGNGFLGNLAITTHTTPDAVTLQNLIRRYRNEGAASFALEVSSHALMQNRLNGVLLDTAVFTNLTRDHLDYHGTMENYYAAKRKLFYWRGLKSAVLNIDDPYGLRLYQELKTNLPHLKITTYGFTPAAMLCIEDYRHDNTGMTLALRTKDYVWHFPTPLIGRFNALNLAAVAAVLMAWEETGLNPAGGDLAAVLAAIKPAAGRMQTLRYPDRPLVVVDYAHTPDALKNTLQTLRELKPHLAKIWCVFGCGGNRDHGKRPLMGKIAEEYADCVVITSDNPRNEEPMAIIREILPVANAVLVEPDRLRAIEYAVAHAGSADMVLIAGKGHETYQEIKGVKYPFDDADKARGILTS